MRKIRAVAVAAAVFLGVVGLAAPASAHGSLQPQAHIIGPVIITGDTARVTALYNCQEGEHLFVSAKQVGDRSRDPRLQQPGSSAVVAQTAGGWWQSHPTNFTCNGRWQIDTFTIGTFEYGIGQLERGQAWLQFCLSHGEEVLEVNLTRWVRVIG